MTLLSAWPQDSDWTPHLQTALNSDSFRELEKLIATERAAGPVYPAPENVFRAFHLTPYASTRVVILGQDPYHGEGQADGLCFSVPAGTRLPPSLKNIFRELAEDLPLPGDQTGDLSHWARSGVLLLNTVLTVRAGAANSHRKRGWETFTDEVMLALNEHPHPLLFVLWGKPAQSKKRLIDERHSLIESVHPSPLSAYRGFLGSRPFSRINAWLASQNAPPIHWVPSG